MIKASVLAAFIIVAVYVIRFTPVEEFLTREALSRLLEAAGLWAGAKAAGIKYSVWVEESKDNDRSLAEGEHIGRIKMILDEREKPLGVQILGPHAGDLVSEWVAIMNGGMKLSTPASAVHPYPTLGEINKKVAGTFLSQKLFSEKVRKGLTFFFHLKGRACGGDISDPSKSILENPS